MENYTEFINNNNIQNIRNQIERKKGFQPYYATLKDASEVITDFDSFPYKRFYRGEPMNDKPVILEREAGWRVRHDNCYRFNNLEKIDNYPKHCFQTACNTVFPCYPEKLNKYADREALEIQLNNNCIVKYR